MTTYLTLSAAAPMSDCRTCFGMGSIYRHAGHPDDGGECPDCEGRGNDGDDHEWDEDECWRCDGDGFLSTCPDDFCQGSDGRIHDSPIYRRCPECNDNDNQGESPRRG